MLSTIFQGEDLQPTPNAKSYACIQGNNVINVCLWTGDVNDWQPPSDWVMIELPEGSPVHPGYIYDHTTLTFTNPNEPTLEQVKLDKINEIVYACDTFVFGTHTSNALGSSHTYYASAYDQSALNAAVTASILNANNTAWTINYKCIDSDGVEAYRPHTASQIQQVAQDVIGAVLSADAKKATLLQQIQNATTLDELNLIKWD